MTDQAGYRAETLALHGGQQPDPTTNARAVPIYQTTSYVFNDTDHAANLFALKEFGNIYSRIMNPTTDVLEKRVAALEGGVAGLATASGQAAATLAIFTLMESGCEVVSSQSLYGGTYNLFHYTLPKLGIKVHFVDPTPQAFADCLKKNPKIRAAFGEMLGNPKLDIFDIEPIAAVCHEAGVPLIIDNTTPSPYLCNPIKYGADIVIHSCTKFIGGHGTSIGGMIVDGGTFKYDNGRFPNFTEPDPSYHGMKIWDIFGNFEPFGGVNIAFIIKARVQMLRDIGACMSPFNAFLFLQGLETLHLRMERHSQNAIQVAEFLSGHKAVEWVNYTGLKNHPTYSLASKYFTRGLCGAIMGFGIKGGREAGRRLIEHVKLLSHLANIGDSKSLIIHPATTTHQQLTAQEQQDTGVTDDYVRLSIGTENVDDIIEDLDQALAASQK